jgi:hypothetical protein
MAYPSTAMPEPQDPPRPGWVAPATIAVAALALAAGGLAAMLTSRLIATPVVTTTTTAALIVTAPGDFASKACSAMAQAIRDGKTGDPGAMSTLGNLAAQSSNNDIRFQGNLLVWSAQLAQNGTRPPALTQSAEDFEAVCQSAYR